MADILIVDDDPEIQTLLHARIETLGHTVRHVTDGPGALSEVESKRPDLILLDVSLPGMDGFEVCRRLKENPATRDIPIIMITAAYPTVEDAGKGLQLGADEYMDKPFNWRILEHNIARLLG